MTILCQIAVDEKSRSADFAAQEHLAYARAAILPFSRWNKVAMEDTERTHAICSAAEVAGHMLSGRDSVF